MEPIMWRTCPITFSRPSLRFSRVLKEKLKSWNSARDIQILCRYSMHIAVKVAGTGSWSRELGHYAHTNTFTIFNIGWMIMMMTYPLLDSISCWLMPTWLYGSADDLYPLPDSRAYIVLEYLPKTLSCIISDFADNGGMPLPLIWTLLHQLLKALRFLHKQQVSHDYSHPLLRTTNY
jgi:serine/threonine protein kinase